MDGSVIDKVERINPNTNVKSDRGSGERARRTFSLQAVLIALTLRSAAKLIG
jgi:hypothetical protein